MTTYTKETALYDTGRIGEDIEEAGTKADNYLTDVSGGGVMVHPSDDSTSGWKISSALELLKSGVSYIWAGLVNNIATVRIGKEAGGHSVIDENGMRIYGGNNGLTELANIGYSNGSPYYSFGRRLTTQSVYSPTSRYFVGDMCLYNDGAGQKLYVCKVETPFGGEAWNSDHWQDAIGLYSFSENGTAVNIGNAASGFGSHAEGRSTVAVGSNSHTEGRNTIASDESHAEGNASKALGDCSHAEGWYTKARGQYSHSQNETTEATKKAQTALGSFNESDESSTTTHPSGDIDYGQYAVIVGNGTSSVDLSNALTVDWNGNVEAAGALFANGAEFSKQADNHLVIGGYHVCWGTLTVNSPTLNAYAEQTVTLPYTYTGTPFCIASCANRAARARTAYASQGDQTGNKIRVGYYATASGVILINYLTIGV